MNATRLVFILAFTTLLGGCATMAPPAQQQTVQSAEQYYSEARKAQAGGSHHSAIDAFNDLEQHYPQSPYAQLAPLEIGYARYKLHQYNAALSETERFIAQNPNHANLDYAIYLQGLIRSAQGLDNPAADPGQQKIIDSGHAREAFKKFSTVVQRFPDSGYRDNALQRMSQLRDLMARKELETVKQQLARGERQAAFKHAKYIAEQYPKTPAAEEALELVTRASSVQVSPTAEVMPVTKPIAPTTGDETIRREAWLLQQDPRHFTLQIVGTSSREGIERYIKQHKLQNKSAYFRRTHDNKDWYSLLYGNFSSRGAAIGMAERLKNELKLDNIWIRRFDDVQASIIEGNDN